ncbi:octopamine receptor beta-3R-like protein [Sarcoptes scabiei]|uniref:Octopamine receptor beta-3R-like protein n=1 Tax=Sarcoptes scabiei TaxID=52283 RepID=A0A132AHW6_SARSC|nr:octopamine receptor beta-3R-like protein [Sarcoptes scabiei]
MTATTLYNTSIVDRYPIDMEDSKEHIRQTKSYAPSSSSSSYTSSSSSSSSLLYPDETLTKPIDIVIVVLKILILSTIILAAIFGNLLVIIAVFRHHRLRMTTNFFIVSLAFADILVALFAMTFNASVVISGKWMFNTIICDFWNSCDVLFSTASIMHLSCISYDRYYAIIKPLDYPMKVTGKRVAIMLTCVWISSALISYIPIFTGIYTTDEAIEMRRIYDDRCEWIVNIPYALISSTVST